MPLPGPSERGVSGIKLMNTPKHFVTSKLYSNNNDNKRKRLSELAIIAIVWSAYIASLVFDIHQQ